MSCWADTAICIGLITRFLCFWWSVLPLFCSVYCLRWHSALFSAVTILLQRDVGQAKDFSGVNPRIHDANASGNLQAVGDAGTALLLLLFAGFQVYTAVTTESYIDADEIYYQYYMKHVEGPLTQESVDWLSQQQEEFRPIYQLNAALMSKKVTHRNTRQ